MSDRPERPQEQEAVKTTIVGGRPPGSGRRNASVPRGIEVLVKKASVDQEFRALLIERRAAAADTIGLALDPAERAMIDGIPAEQLEAIIASTAVPLEQRRIFLGKVAASMLAALGVGAAAGCQKEEPKPVPQGIAPDRPAEEERTRGIQPDRPAEKSAQPAQPGQQIEATDGIRPDRPPPAPPAPTGIRPDRPPETQPEPPPLTKGIQPDRP